MTKTAPLLREAAKQRRRPNYSEIVYRQFPRGSITPSGPGYVVSSHRHVEKVVTDDRQFRSDVMRVVGDTWPTRLLGELLHGPLRNLMAPVLATMDHSIVFTNDEEHRAMKQVLAPSIRPATIENLNEQWRDRAAATVHNGVRRGGFDLVGDYARPLVQAAVCDLLGIPLSDRRRVFSWLAPSVSLASQADLRAGVVRAPQLVHTEWQLYRYLHSLLHRETPPNAFLLDALKTLHEQAMSSQPDLSHEERTKSADHVTFANFNALLQGATVNLESLISLGAQRLLADPGLREQVREHAVSMPQLVKEVGRWESTLRVVFRITENDVEIDGRTIPANHRVLALIHEANHDPAVFDRPDDFLPERWRPNGEHDGVLAHADAMTLGDGLHRCIGGPLTMLEAAGAWQPLLDASNGLRVSQVRLRRMPGIAVYGFESIPIETASLGLGRSLY